jgi:hypothetical protein
VAVKAGTAAGNMSSEVHRLPCKYWVRVCVLHAIGELGIAVRVIVWPFAVSDPTPFQVRFQLPNGIFCNSYIVR